MPRLRLRAVVPLVVLAAAVAVPASAQAICPIGGCVVTRTYSNTLTVTRTAGTVTSAPAGISCGAVCSKTDTQTVTCDPLSDCPLPDELPWTTYVLTASGGPGGFAPQWNGACTGATCSVTLDANKTAALTWVDVQPPSVTLTAPAGTKVGATTPVAASASDNGAVAKVEFLLDGAVAAQDTTAPYGAVLDLSSLADGSQHTLAARAVDSEGNVSATAPQTVMVDKLVSLTLGALPAYTNASTLPLAFTTDADATTRCALDGAAPTACASPFSAVSPTTPDGTHVYAVTATDDVGNTASDTRSFVVDRTPPAVTFTDGPPEGGQIATDAVTISFAVADANPHTVTCSLDGETPRACSASDADDLAGLADGTHRLAIAAVDNAGNVGRRVRTFAVKPGGGGVPTVSQVVNVNNTNTTTVTVNGEPPAAIAMGFRRARGATTFTSLAAQGVPAGGRVDVRCTGGKCPRRRASYRGPGPVRLRDFVRRALPAGTVLDVRISRSGAVAQTVRITVHARRDPSTRLL